MAALAEFDREAIVEGTVEEIAAAFHVRRSTLYRYLSAGQDGPDCALVVYRNTRPGKIDPGTNRRYGETGRSESVQLEADRKWWPVAPVRERRLKAMVYVVDGTVTRVRAVQPGGAWQRDDRGYADIPLTPPLTGQQIAEQFPALGIRLGDPRPHVRGKSGSTCRYEPAFRPRRQRGISRIGAMHQRRSARPPARQARAGRYPRFHSWLVSVGLHPNSSSRVGLLSLKSSAPMHQSSKSHRASWKS
jgi:hypothetical protein